jgi:NAD(P)-dependent dehydrogenase (short-subunit alcohol dehydrogenase family)
MRISIYHRSEGVTSMKRILITGANRGLGLAFTEESLNRGYRVFATCRHPNEANDLHARRDEYPDRLTILRLDVTDEGSIDASAREVEAQEGALDLLINNAGVNPEGERLGALDAETMLHTYHVNTVGPMQVAQRLLGLLRSGDDPKILNISSTSGSLARKSSGGGYSYASSKSALNMLTRALAFDLESDGIIVVAIHPGWVRTDMGGSAAPLASSDSARGVLDLAKGLTQSDTGSFYNYKGQQPPW